MQHVNGRYLPVVGRQRDPNRDPEPSRFSVDLDTTALGLTVGRDSEKKDSFYNPDARI